MLFRNYMNCVLYIIFIYFYNFVCKPNFYAKLVQTNYAHLVEKPIKPIILLTLFKQIVLLLSKARIDQTNQASIIQTYHKTQNYINKRQLTKLLIDCSVYLTNK